MPTVTTLSITLPPAAPPRDTYFCIRMTQAEKREVQSLAQRLHVPASALARHLLLQAVQHFTTGEETSFEA
jgi:hypothetical protein